MPFLLRSRNKGNVGGGSGFGGLALADFVNGGYIVGETSLTASDVVDDTGRISASGLSITGTGVEYLGDFRDILLTCNWTAVVEMNLVASGHVSHKVYPFYMFDAGGNSELYAYTRTSGSGQGWRPELYDWSTVDGFAERYVETTSAYIDPGVIQVAWTRTNAAAAMSYNGGAVDASGDTLNIGAVASVFGGEHASSGAVTESGHVRSITIYAPQDNSALPGLSTIS